MAWLIQTLFLTKTTVTVGRYRKTIEIEKSRKNKHQVESNISIKVDIFIAISKSLYWNYCFPNQVPGYPGILRIELTWWTVYLQRRLPLRVGQDHTPAFPIVRKLK